MKIDNIGKTIKKQRKKKGYSLRELAKLTNLSHSTLGMWEQGRNLPSFQSLYKVLSMLDLEITIQGGAKENGECQ